MGSSTSGTSLRAKACSRWYVVVASTLTQVEKYELGHFGVCPRVYCASQHVLPCGRSDLPGLDTVKLYCPNCLDTYTPPSSRFHGIDGAFFGTTFPHLLLQCYRDLAPSILAPPDVPAETEHTAMQTDERASAQAQAPKAPPIQDPTLSVERLGHKIPQTGIYVPRIYGFRVSEFALSGPRMQWLRMRPHTVEELNS